MAVIVCLPADLIASEIEKCSVLRAVNESLSGSLVIESAPSKLNASVPKILMFSGKSTLNGSNLINLLPLELFISNFYMFPCSSAYLINSMSCRALVGMVVPMRCTFKN
ncbi:MAG: hypothetical protein ABF991_13590 [Liquorilactobacillus hordei]|uniref:hypothetical protein n=1 Tax=Liquorilactobacillus hordei TaxID=468911 RepID=UPI0039E9C170